MPLINPENITMSVRHLVETDRRSEIRMGANGGNSVLVVCPPDQEQEFIDAIIRLMPQQNYKVIDLNEILNAFIGQCGETLHESFNLLRGSIGQIFKKPSGETGTDLYKLILETITETFEEGKIPVLIRTGALYGTDIENIHIMESPQVMHSGLPLIILYPATHSDGNLLFLGSRPASKYRCMIIE